jgi:hypothetical protein
MFLCVCVCVCVTQRVGVGQRIHAVQEVLWNVL